MIGPELDLEAVGGLAERASHHASIGNDPVELSFLATSASAQARTLASEARSRLEQARSAAVRDIRPRRAPSASRAHRDAQSRPPARRGKGRLRGPRRRRSLDKIARRAGVGIGTLYRHFPSRDALVEAVYRREVQRLAVAASRLGKSLPAGDALHKWMLLFVDYIAAKKVIAPALGTIVGGASELYAASGARITEAMSGLVAHHQRRHAGRRQFRRSLARIVGFAHASKDPDWEASAKRLIDILMDGLRATRWDTLVDGIWSDRSNISWLQRKTARFARCAHILSISQSTVAEAIRELEGDLGFPLFQRKSQGVELDSEGQPILAPRAQDTCRCRGGETITQY